MAHESDRRSILRLPCSLSVADARRSSPIGVISDISLDGFHLETDQPLPVGAVLPVAFKLGSEGEKIKPTAEVVHVTKSGNGCRIISLTGQDGRRLRRYVSELTNIEGNRASAKNLLGKGDKPFTEPFSDPAKIRTLLGSAVGWSTAFTLIADTRTVREKARLTQTDADGLTMTTEGLSDFRPGEAVFVLYTMQYVSYTFETTIREVNRESLKMDWPTHLSYSERRTRGREALSGARVSLVLPWRNEEVLSWPVIERSPSGLSFKAEPREVYFWPGVVLPKLTITSAGNEEVITDAQVRHLTAINDAEGSWVKIGVAFSVTPQETLNVEKEELASSRGVPAPVRWGRDLMARVAYMYHRTVRRVATQQTQQKSQVVRFENTLGQPVVGLLDIAITSATQEKMAFVVVAPGFGARKETMVGLAAAITENFRRQHKNVAVLRYDGTNSIGESYKNPGSEATGKEHLKWTVSAGISDLLGAIKWGNDNKQFESDDVVIVSVSFSSIAVRRALTLSELRSVKLWVSFMGAPDAQNAIMHVAGNVDGYGSFLKGIKVGTVSLLGCFIDSDHFCADMHHLGVANLDDAKADMKKISADVVWFIGKNDAFMDAARVKAVMEVPSSGKRKIIEVEAGHVPQSSDEALAEFALLTRMTWRALYGSDIDAVQPSRGRLALTMQEEWNRVRNQSPLDQKTYWENYLLGGESGLGFDVWNLTPEYSRLLLDTAGAAEFKNKDVLDLGAGTGNLARILANGAPSSLTCIDIVPAALDVLRKKLNSHENVRVLEGNIDGSPLVAVRRWLAGDLPSLTSLMARFPKDLQADIMPVLDAYDEGLHAYLRYGVVDLNGQAKKTSLKNDTVTALLSLRNVIAYVRGEIDAATAKERLPPHWATVVTGHHGLPFEDSSFDVVFSSLVLSYMSNLSDCLFEVRRILRPGGRFVASTLMPDTDQSKVFVTAIEHVQSMHEKDLPGHLPRETILKGLREFIDRGANLLRLEEEGTFTFWSASEFQELMQRASFKDTSILLSFGTPAQGAIVGGTK